MFPFQGQGDRIGLTGAIQLISEEAMLRWVFHLQELDDDETVSP